MANECVGGLADVRGLTPEYGLDRANFQRSNDLAGIVLPKTGSAPLNGVFLIPAATLTTGLTFKGALTNILASDVGLVVRLGITVKRLAADESTDLDAAAGAEQTVDVTLSANDQGIALISKAIANANLDSGAVGDLVAVRVRRIGTSGNDTAVGAVLLLAFGALAT